MNFDEIVCEILLTNCKITSERDGIHIHSKNGVVLIDKSNRIPFLAILRKKLSVDGFILGLENVTYSAAFARIALGPIGELVRDMPNDEMVQVTSYELFK